MAEAETEAKAEAKEEWNTGIIVDLQICKLADLIALRALFTVHELGC